MDYAKAAEMAPALRLGMKPLVDKDSLCSGKDATTKMPKICSATFAKEMDACEPNGKACLRAIENNGVGYAMGDVTRMYNDADKIQPHVDTGPVQRAQVKFVDVG